MGEPEAVDGLSSALKKCQERSDMEEAEEEIAIKTEVTSDIEDGVDQAQATTPNENELSDKIQCDAGAEVSMEARSGVEGKSADVGTSGKDETVEMVLDTLAKIDYGEIER